VSELSEDRGKRHNWHSWLYVQHHRYDGRLTQTTHQHFSMQRALKLKPQPSHLIC